MENEKKNLIKNEHTFLELPIEKYEFYSDPEVLSYISIISQNELYNEETINEFISKKDKDLSAREKLIKTYMYLPVLVAREYSSITTLSNIDLISEGTIGLMSAIDNYKITDGDLYDYLIKNVHKSVVSACARVAKSASISKNNYYRLIKINEIIEELNKEYQREPLREEVVEEVTKQSKKDLNGWSPNGICLDNLINLRFEMGSLDTIDLEKELGEDTSIDLDRLVELEYIRKVLLDTFKNIDLTKEEKYVLLSTYGFIEFKTTEELAKELETNALTIRKYQRRALNKVRNYTSSKLCYFRNKRR